jgi:hypothetical protein
MCGRGRGHDSRHFHHLARRTSRSNRTPTGTNRPDLPLTRRQDTHGLGHLENRQPRTPGRWTRPHPPLRPPPQPRLARHRTRRAPKAISERMGHSEIGVTMNVYGHLFEAPKPNLPTISTPSSTQPESIVSLPPSRSRLSVQRLQLSAWPWTASLLPEYRDDTHTRESITTSAIASSCTARR